ncbi:hypothetical protein PT974_05119 [Cladobotryum mycophilum]|uniref:Uncharacterized protein n=1 Tax=Cladobotryum mycophilum TaxID=491253 RepID=A0ABR0SRT2_9HYPO
MMTNTAKGLDSCSPTTSTTGITQFTPETDPTIINDLWDGRKYSIPWAGNTYNIIEKSTGRALVLKDGGYLCLRDIGEDQSPLHRWLCVEKNGYFGFANVQTGRYVGHDNNWGMRAWAIHHEGWEFLTPRRHPDGGYELLVPHWWHTLRKVCMLSATGTAKLKLMKLSFTFRERDIPSMFIVNLQRPLPFIEANAKATLTYNSTDELSGEHTFQNNVQGQTLTLLLDNGVEIVGEIDHPMMSAEEFQGVCSWIW